jgi:type IV pilus assembly protein PilB
MHMLAPKQEDHLVKKLAEMRREAEERDASRRAARSGAMYVNLSKAPISIEAVRLIPEAEAREAKAAAVELKIDEVAVAAVDPKSPAVAALLEKLKTRHFKVRTFLVSPSSLEQAWYLYKFISAEQKDITGKVEIEKKRFEEELSRIHSLADAVSELKRVMGEKSTTSELLEIILAGALALGASDIHMEAEENSTRVRYRLDGVLHDAAPDLASRSYDNIITRIKLLSGLKMNIHGEPQDGRFTINLPTKEIEMRVSIIPSEFGETIVMRILDPDSLAADLPDLGLRPDDLAIVERELSRPNGLILNTGPTGSGKTTTLYAFLRHLLNPEIKIITVEDPIEYRIQGIEQTQTKEDVGYTFAGGLRAILRQDPDVILIGEIRDHETADIALQASLTGHLVLSTLHTNDAVGSIPRLVDLEIKPATIGPALSLVIAQRLVRKLCPHCRKEKEVPAELKAKIKAFLEKLPARVDRAPYGKTMLSEPVGCEKCSGIGYKGRIGIFEFFVATPEFETTILKEVSEVSLKKLAADQGMVQIQQDGILKSLRGETSLEEVESVTGPLEW